MSSLASFLARGICGLSLSLLVACALMPFQKNSTQDLDSQGDIWSWDYSSGPRGPGSWSKLNPQYGLCSQGHAQSPIDLRWGLPSKANPLKIMYREGSARVTHGGYTLRVEVTPQSSIRYRGKDYFLEKMEFRSPSEHSLSGRFFPMELQLYHRSSNGLRQAIVSLFMEKGPKAPWFEKFWQFTSPSEKTSSPVVFTLNPDQLLPASKTFYHYEGSLTHPPCLERVQWFVFNTPLSLSPEQIHQFRKIFVKNNRPLQPLRGRKVKNF